MKATESADGDYMNAKCIHCGHQYAAHILGLCDECPDEECECDFEAVRYAGGVFSPEAEQAAYARAMRGE